MPYRIMKSLISSSAKSNEELATMADVYYGAKRMTKKEYTEVIGLIEQREEE